MKAYTQDAEEDTPLKSPAKKAKAASPAPAPAPAPTPADEVAEHGAEPAPAPVSDKVEHLNKLLAEQKSAPAPQTKEKTGVITDEELTAQHAIGASSSAVSAVYCRYGAFCRTKGCKYEHLKPALDGHSGLGKLSEIAELDAERCGQMWEQSKAKVEAKLEKFQDKKHIATVPVYLAVVKPYANMREQITAGKMHKMIDEDFKNMSVTDYEFHALRDFFVPRKDKQPGYQAKMIDTGILRQGKESMFDVDHVVPSRWGGIDHPRNMVVMHRSM